MLRIVSRGKCADRLLTEDWPSSVDERLEARAGKRQRCDISDSGRHPVSHAGSSRQEVARWTISGAMCTPSEPDAIWTVQTLALF